MATTDKAQLEPHRGPSARQPTAWTVLLRGTSDAAVGRASWIMQARKRPGTMRKVVVLGYTAVSGHWGCSAG